MNQADNRVSGDCSSAPLLPLLQRVAVLTPTAGTDKCDTQDWSDASSPTECLLRYLELPEDDMSPVDLEQAAVVVMCHLDRLATPLLAHSTSPSPTLVLNSHAYKTQVLLVLHCHFNLLFFVHLHFNVYCLLYFNKSKNFHEK